MGYWCFSEAQHSALQRGKLCAAGRNFVAGVVCVWRGDTVSACVRAAWFWP